MPWVTPWRSWLDMRKKDGTTPSSLEKRALTTKTINIELIIGVNRSVKFDMLLKKPAIPLHDYTKLKEELRVEENKLKRSEAHKELARYEDEGWNDPVFPGEEGLDYKNHNIEQLLGVMECKVDMLIKNAIPLMGRSEDVCGMTSDMMRQLQTEPSLQEAFEDLMVNFILDQEEKVKQLEEYMSVIGNDFMQHSWEVIAKLKEEIRVEENRVKKIEKITRYPDTEDLEPLSDCKFLETLTKKHPPILPNSSR
ncbi:hypothetical protein Tco_1345710 [Tanacetum coccineum]